MAHVVADRVRETTSTTGTGAFTLTGAIAGFKTFASMLATNGDTCWYCAQYGSEWEVGLGTRASSTSLTRTTVLASSNSGSATSFTVAPEIFITQPAKALSSRAVPLGNSGTSTQTLNQNLGKAFTSTATGNHTVALSGGTPGVFEAFYYELTNGGSYTITLPTINWVKPDGTTTTSLSTYLTALGIAGRTSLQAAGTDRMLLWSMDGFTTTYGTFVK